MFDSIAKRRLEKEVVRLVQEKGAIWCVDSLAVQGELLENHPKEQGNVEALCRVVTIGGFVHLLSLPELVTERAMLASAVQRVQQQGSSAKEARWAVGCWAAALARIPYAERAQLIAELTAQAEASEKERRRIEAERRRAQAAEQERQRIAAVEHDRRRIEEDERQQRLKAERQQRVETERRQAEATKAEHQRRVETERRQAEAAQKERRRIEHEEAERQRKAVDAEVKRQQPLIERWRLAFPKEAAAIQETADLATQARVRAETARLKEEAYKEKAYEKAPRESRPSRSPEPEAMMGSFGASPKRELPGDKAIKRMMQQNAIEVRFVVDAEILRRIQTAPDQEALHRKMDAAWQADLQRRENETQRQREEKNVAHWKQHFPLRCAGLSDREILQQIEAETRNA